MREHGDTCHQVALVVGSERPLRRDQLLAGGLLALTELEGSVESVLEAPRGAGRDPVAKDPGVPGQLTLPWSTC